MADPAGSIATISSSLDGKDTHTASFRVYGTPTWFGQRPVAAGVSAYMTQRRGGHHTSGDDACWRQLLPAAVRAHWRQGHALSSFEVKLIEDIAVCTLVPTSGAMSGSYVGTVQGELSGAYSTELLKRSQDLEDTSMYFTKYSRFGKLSYMQSTFGHLGYVRFTMVGSGSCLVSATVTSFYYDGGTTWVSGVSNGDSRDAARQCGGAVRGRCSGRVRPAGDEHARAEHGFLEWAQPECLCPRPLVLRLTTRTRALTSSVTIGEAQASGSVTATVSAGSFSHAINFTVVRLSAPTLQVDDGELQALPGSCGGFQSTRLRALSDEHRHRETAHVPDDSLFRGGRSTLLWPRGLWSLGWGQARRRCMSRRSAFASVTLAVDGRGRRGVVTLCGGGHWGRVVSQFLCSGAVPADAFAPVHLGVVGGVAIRQRNL